MCDNKSKAMFAGSFDPITNGHLDIIERASKIFDELQIGILINPNKNVVFDLKERMALVKECTKHLNNVKIIYFEGLLVDYCQQNGIKTLVRGVRSSSDVDYELQMAHMNKNLNSDIETIFLPTNPQFSFISSSLIKEVLKFGADIENLVPKVVLDELKKRSGKL